MPEDTSRGSGSIDAPFDPTSQSAIPPPSNKAVFRGVTWRAILIALPLLVLNVWWITVIEVKWYTLDGTSLPLQIEPIFLLLVVTVANLVVRKLGFKFALDQGELLTVYVMLVMSGIIAAHDTVQDLFGVLAHIQYWSVTHPEAHYEVFMRYIPRWLFVWNADAVQKFYLGNSSPWVHHYWIYWVRPLAIWGVFIMAIVTALLCIDLLIRKAWTEHEKLAFPLVQLPVAMTGDSAHGQERPFFRNPVMWGGFTLAFSIGLLNGLHVLFPSVPYLSAVKQYNVGNVFTTRPWNSISNTNISMYPFMIGLTFFMPTDLSFSAWFFYVLRKVWTVFGTALGWDQGNSGFPYLDQQAVGAWLGLAVAILIAAIPYFRGVLQQARRGRDDPDDPAEAVRLRWAIIGLVVCLTILGGITAYAGMAFWMILVLFAFYFLMAITITRLRAELGAPHETYVNPQYLVGNLLPLSMVGPGNLTMVSVMHWWNRGYRAVAMPAELEAMKMAEGGRMQVSRLAFALLLAAVFSLICAYWANLSVTYAAGGLAKAYGFKVWLGNESFDRLSGWLRNPIAVERNRVASWFYVMVGVVLIVALRSLRLNFADWPLHPAGYALGVSFAMEYFWFAVLIGWTAKVLINRYAGRAGFVKAAPFFLGLILGDYTIGSIWGAIGALFGITTYKIFI